MTAFTLTELARRAGVSARTVRYYIQRGLLTAPVFRGPDTQYDDGHLLGLQAIRALQEAYWPLDSIASVLKGRSEEQLRAIAGGKLPAMRLSMAERRVPTLSAPAPAALVAAPSNGEGSRGSRIRLAEGLELWLDDDASNSVQRLADAIRELAVEHQQPGDGGRDE